MNLRKASTDEYKVLAGLSTERQEKCELRKKNELEVTTYNSEIHKKLTQILNPMAERIKMGIKITICDDDCYLKTRVCLSKGKRNITPELSFPIGSVHSWMSTASGLKAKINQIEMIMRSVRLYSTATNLNVVDPGRVVVNFDTRNRYF